MGKDLISGIVSNNPALFPIDNETERASMLWHKDDFGYKSLDLFIPITELNSSNGSMFYLNKKDNLHIFNRIPEFILDAKPKERNKVKINDFGKYYSENEIKEFTGKIGDALLIDIELSFFISLIFLYIKS